MNIFQEELLKIDKTRRCLQAHPGRWNLPLGDIYFGVPQSEFFGWAALEKLPAEVSGFSFYLGSDCAGLIEAFTKSDFTSQVERLSIGDCSYALGSGRDYENISRILANADYPNLRTFELGVWELFSNSHGLYGKIGNVTKLLRKMPNLESLSLYGAFQLDDILTFQRLKSLTVTLDDYTTCVNGGFISQKSLDNVLSSDYPELHEAFIDLECEENDQEYTIPEVFLSGLNVPNLQKIEFTGGYKGGESEIVENSPLGKRNGFHVHFEKPE